MKVSRTENFDITPDRSIFHKIGEANYSISDAIAELVDNSIDAADEDGVEIYVILDKLNNKIIISDNGVGMTKDIAAKALVLAYSTKKGSLGEFGLGLKSACTSLGKHFSITTTPIGSSESYTLSYDKDNFMENGDWKAFPITVNDVSKEEHGTTVEISSLRVKLYDALVTRLKNDLSQRYGPFILHNNVIIKVGLGIRTAKPCEPEPIELDDSGKRDFEFVLTNGGKINGWWGLRKIASGEQSGFDMFRRGRLIRASEKLGYYQHPMTNHVTGEIFLDSVPVTHNKREFITESGEFREFIENFWGDKTGKLTGEKQKGLIDVITKESQARWNQEKVDKQLPDTIRDAVKDNILKAMNRVEDFKELAFPGFNEQIKKSKEGSTGPMEKRRPSKVAAEEPEDVDDKHEADEKRTPIHTQKRTAKFIVINGKKFRFDFFWRNLGDETMDKETVMTDNGIEIYINTGFKGFNLSKDSNFYCIHHVSEAIALMYLQENNQPLSRVFDLRNKLIFEVASVILEEDEIKELSKREAELEKIRKEKSELINKAKQSSLI